MFYIFFIFAAGLVINGFFKRYIGLLPFEKSKVEFFEVPVIENALEWAPLEK